jgi:hypothetical protein
MACPPAEINPGVAIVPRKFVRVWGFKPKEFAHWFDKLGLKATLIVEEVRLLINPLATPLKEPDPRETRGIGPEKAITSTPDCEHF